MVMWWAGFFILALIFPSYSIHAPMGALLITVIVLGRWGERRRLQRVILYASTSLVIWTGASLAALEREHCTGRRAESRIPTVSGIRARLVGSLEDGHLGERSEALLAALLLASRARLGVELREAYAYLGIAHFLALSGLHLGAIMIPLAWLMSLLPFGRTMRQILVIAAVIAYTAVAGFPPSLVRATALTFVFIAQRWFGRQTTLVRSLALGVFALALIDCDILFEGGFQLSCAAVCAIALLGIPVNKEISPLMPNGWMGRVSRAALAAVLVTVSVNLFTLPLVLMFFKRAPLLAPLFNLVMILPVTIMLYLGIGYCAIPIGAVRAALALPIDALARFLWSFPLHAASGPQPALYAGQVQWVPYVAGVGLLVISVRTKCMNRRFVLAAATALIAVSLLMIRTTGESLQSGYSYPCPDLHRPTSHSCFLREGCGVLFLDGDIGQREAIHVVQQLWGRGIHRVGYLVVGPALLGRRSGAYHLLARLEIKTIVCSPYLALHDTRFLRAVDEREARLVCVAQDDSIMVGEAAVLLRAPPYPPPRGSSIPADRARMHYEICCGRSKRENAN